MTPRQENALFFFVAIATVGVYLLRSMKASLRHYSDWFIGNLEAEIGRDIPIGDHMQNLKQYSKLWAGLAAVIAGIIGANMQGADIGMIEAGILLALTGAGIYVPRNAEKSE